MKDTRRCDTPLPPSSWVPLVEVLEILHHPDFYWGIVPGFTDCKYMELRIDTRDNGCLVKDRHGKPVDLTQLKEALTKVTLKGMNENKQI